MLLKDRVAIITGGAKGMGRGMALKFAQEGCDVVIADINMQAANETLEEVKKIGRDGLVIKCDISNRDEVREMVNQTISKFKKIDILVNGAGGIIDSLGPVKKSVATLPQNAWDRVISINLTGTFYCCQEVVPYMKEQKYGKIINLSSLGAIHAAPVPQPHYHAAKAGIHGLTYDMACELGRYNIGVNVLMPGPIRTPFYDELLAGKSEEEVEGFFKMLGGLAPLQRVGTPEDIAGAALFLASDLSAYVTGAVIPVTGGMPLQPNHD
ncbi:MAG: SDR family NAD(P)-dependent oxidoreductase [Clostridia bacterium]|nr:SDR family NAD(P)-dependent oxidoreductase [Clostridia bacterium]